MKHALATPTRFQKRALSALAVLAVLSFLYTYASIYSTSNADVARQPRGPAVLGDLTDLVNVFIGTTGSGHVFPGATRPHGMVKVGMDTDSPDNHAGYDADPRYLVTGFSQLHEDGTGGATPLSNFKLFPLAHCARNASTGEPECATSFFDRKVARKMKVEAVNETEGTKGGTLFGGAVADDVGRPGYFATNLSSGVRVELTATRRTALHRYTFPSRSSNAGEDEDGDLDWRPRILVDITNDGQRSGGRAFADIDPDMGRVTGGARFRGSFGPGQYDAFVCVDFRSAHDLDNPLVPAEYGTYAGRRVAMGATNLTSTLSDQGALLTFLNTPSPPSSFPPARFHARAPVNTDEETTTTILARVGISLIAPAQACANAEAEIPDFDFEGVREAARAEWAELLGRFEIEAGEEQREDAVLFYSSLYRSHIVPADYTGENPGWESTEPYFDSLYCNWDTYRTLFPLMSLHDPFTFARVVRAFIDVQQHEGWLPECRSATLPQFVQGGSSGDPILAEFYIKFKEHVEALGVSPETLYGALLADAEIEPENWRYMGRQANAWKEYGYIPSGLHEKGGMDTRQVSRTLEYSFDDFTISQVARELGLIDDWQKYQNRSRGWESLWNAETVLHDVADVGEVEGIHGFMQPKYAKNESFGYTDPRRCTVHDPRHSTCFLDGGNHDGFYEGGSIVYSQYVPHDTAKLIELQGGADAFIRRLDYIFDNDYFDATNEPSQQMPFMYHYADRPGLSTERSREAIAKAFSTAVDGLPGNDDSGAMASFVVFHMLGLYPLPGTREVLVSSPFFHTVRIRNPLFGTTTTIRAHGFERKPRDGPGGNIYVKSIRINGDPWHSTCYIVWKAFELGATIDLELTNDRTLACGKNGSGLPPSLSTGGYGSLP